MRKQDFVVRATTRTAGRFSAHVFFALFSVAAAAVGHTVCGDDQPQWGERYSRNMISGETGLPDHFNPETGEGIKWSVSLGNRAYGTPIVAHGRVLVGVNNSGAGDPRHQGDRGALLCLDESDGRLHWRLVVPKLKGDNDYLDQPNYGICSPATVEGDRVYVVTNRAEVVCLDLHGQVNGNGGPYQDEGRHMALAGQPPLEVTGTDADILWLFDMPSEVGMNPHDAAHTSILIHGRYLYLNTGNGVDSSHVNVPAPDAPSLIVLDKETGRLVARDKEDIGPRIFHSTWSSPALGVVDGRPLVFFCGGDGVVYAFEALPQDLAEGPVQALERVWRYDCDPTAPKEDVHLYHVKNGRRDESPSNILGMPVFTNNRVYVTGGGDFWWGKRQAWAQCIDATKTGDVTSSGQVWFRQLSEHSFSTPAIVDDLVYVADCGRTIYCLDANDGQVCWTHPMKAHAWASPLVADGKVYVGSMRGDFHIFATGREKKHLATIDFEDPVGATPTAANGVLYVATLTRLYAIQKPAR